MKNSEMRRPSRSTNKTWHVCMHVCSKSQTLSPTYYSLIPMSRVSLTHPLFSPGGPNLNPNPYTLHTTPYALRPTPETPHPTPYTLRHNGVARTHPLLARRPAQQQPKRKES